jgi:hypothetical protein
MSNGSSFLKVPSHDDRLRRRSSEVEYEENVREVRRFTVADTSADIYRSRSTGREPRPERRPSSNALVPPSDLARRRSLTSTRRPVRGYTYQPLDRRVRRAIRVLRVQESLRDGLIACELEETSTESSYRALSYTWGSEKDGRETVLINGRPFEIRPNLLAFLRHARKELPGRALWVDAICINQEDNEEKSQQVGMMWKIYSSCREVLVWLGTKADHVGYALKRMEAYVEMNDTRMALSSVQDDKFWEGFEAINSAAYWDR